MSWLSNYLKNVKSGFNILKDSYQTGKAMRNPVDLNNTNALVGQAVPGAISYSNKYPGGANNPANTKKTEYVKDTRNQQANQAAYTLNNFDKEARGDDANYKYEVEIDPDGRQFVTKKYIQPKTTASQSSAFAKDFGLNGIGNDQKYAGLSYDQALKAAQGENEFYRGQTSQRTSSIFNQQTINKADSLISNTQLKLSEIGNDPWNSRGSIESKASAALLKTEQDLSSMFETPEEFDAAYNSSPEFAMSVDTFKELGGNTENLRNGITTKPTLSDTIGGASAERIGQYLNVGNTGAEQKAFNSLIPEGQLAQDQIQRIASIPDDYMDLYLGTPETLGLYQERKLQAQEAKRILEKEAKNAEGDIKAQAKLAKQRYKFEFEEASASIEENRLQAKNYMTGMLAKLGALKTTGKAPEALQTLDTKYQAQKSSLDAQYKFKLIDIDIKLDNELNSIQTDLDREILKVDSATLDDKEKIFNQIMKLQQDADDKIYKLQASFAKTYRTQLEKYQKEAKANSNSYLKSMYNTVKAYDPDAVSKSLGLKEGVYQDGMTFEQYLAERERTEGGKNPFGDGYIGMNFSESGMQKVREDYDNIQTKVKYKGLPTNARLVMEGKQSFKSLTPTKQNDVIIQLDRAGLWEEASELGYLSDNDDSSSDDPWDL